MFQKVALLFMIGVVCPVALAGQSLSVSAIVPPIIPVGHDNSTNPSHACTVNLSGCPGTDETGNNPTWSWQHGDPNGGNFADNQSCCPSDAEDGTDPTDPAGNDADCGLEGTSDTVGCGLHGYYYLQIYAPKCDDGDYSVDSPPQHQ